MPEPLDLEAIKARNHDREHECSLDNPSCKYEEFYYCEKHAHDDKVFDDTSALIAEVERLRTSIRQAVGFLELSDEQIPPHASLDQVASALTILRNPSHGD